jgi:hypothetical protein
MYLIEFFGDDFQKRTQSSNTDKLFPERAMS